ncbi:hypothetical protein B4U80_11560 [Leptotrombidium deliense]|uniref:Uncharacterized protein n=1 Tax=Leptotrombidium deliense TaxID=299467 RepID=A0A443RVF5_9ACAR|nr:hypothetical protein B4U80_11560 [Leptotrombidium deliense]
MLSHVCDQSEEMQSVDPGDCSDDLIRVYYDYKQQCGRRRD